jgi:purine-nucleoside/S-methyl-5'-thioadenosine phosphorylase / adenosine deaminase
MFGFSRKGPIQYLESDALGGIDFIVHAFVTRWGGISQGAFENLNFSFREGDPADRVERNWETLSTAFEVPRRQFFVVNQVHEDRILLIDEEHPKPSDNQLLQYDAIVTDRPGLAIGIKTADCVPILVVDPVRRVIGAIHAGWKGTSLGIAAKAVDALADRYLSKPSDLIVALGPAIGSCCYQVDEAVFESMKGQSGRDSLFRPCREKGRWMFDLVLANRLQLEETGVLAGNIFTAGFCTACRGDFFFSHRREKGVTGRHLNFIMIR